MRGGAFLKSGFRLKEPLWNNKRFLSVGFELLYTISYVRGTENMQEGKQRRQT